MEPNDRAGERNAEPGRGTEATARSDTSAAPSLKVPKVVTVVVGLLAVVGLMSCAESLLRFVGVHIDDSLGPLPMLAGLAGGALFARVNMSIDRD